MLYMSDFHLLFVCRNLLFIVDFPFLSEANSARETLKWVPRTGKHRNAFYIVLRILLRAAMQCYFPSPKQIKICIVLKLYIQRT